ncbi:hypothetical protein CASP1_00040 [Alcaligenes phage CASP1]|nr:hypothetical protein CASP1_00040 [Alcaligenes phage CASP1]
MTRYQALRRLLKLDIVTSFLIVFLNWIWDVPAGKIYFMNVVIEYDTEKTK